MSRRRHNNDFVHSPSSKANKWSQTGLAYLDTAYTKPVSYEIDAQVESTGAHSEIVISHSGRQRDSTVIPGRFSIDWRLEDYAGPEEALEVAVGNKVHVNGFRAQEPGEETKGERPYTDRLYLGGAIEIVLPNEGSERFNLGNVLGLTIVTSDLQYPVWAIDG